MNRRRFLKYAGASAAVVGASALGLDYFSQSRPPTSNQTTTTTVSTSRFNFPPIAKFDLSPKYLNPTDQQTMQFTNLSTDVDGDPLTYEWLIDNQPVSTQKDYSTRLPVGTHLVQLNVSDGTTKSTVTNVATNIVTVEPDQIYPTKPLRIPYKGARIGVGWKGWRQSVPIDVTDEKLNIVCNELGCNAVTIFGNTEFEDDLIEAGTLAISKAFDRIYIQPMYLDIPIDETVQRIGEFARKVKALREMSEKIVFMVGHEFTFDSYGLVPGETYPERLQYPTQNHPNWMTKSYAILPDTFRKIIALCKETYGYKIAYDATIPEGERIVPWSDAMFESVGTSAYVADRYGWNENWIANRLSRLKLYRKPVFFFEWGCQSYKGADGLGGVSEMNAAQYDEETQSNYIQRYCEMLNKLNLNMSDNVSGAFLNSIDDERLNGYGLYKATSPPYFGAGSSRKKGFYMYKSYQRTR